MASNTHRLDFHRHKMLANHYENNQRIERKDNS